MKKVISTLLVALVSLSFTFAQKIAYVNTKDVMGKMEEYNSIQDEINRTSQKWQQELEKMYQDIETKYRDYQANEVIMPEDVRKERQEEIFKLERDAKEYREKKFGYNGELFQLQDSKVKPLQDKVLKAVEAVAQRRRFDFVFDKASGDVTWLYTNATFDLTPDVKKELGVEDATGGDGTGTGGTKPAAGGKDSRSGGK
ncbi:MAG: OmpH family outer membrane protein [Bacteroidia bacterium]